MNHVAATSLATFAPVLVPKPVSETESASELVSATGASYDDQTPMPRTNDILLGELSIMDAHLPFYYPKVRGFRYGYRADPEDQPEDLEDSHAYDHGHDEGREDGHDAPPQNQAPVLGTHNDDEPTSASSTPLQAKKKHTRSPKRVFAKRQGWITLDLYLAGDEGEFTKKMASILLQQYAFTELFKKLYKWGFNTTKGFIKSRVEHDVMVPKDLYMRTYARMKERYAQKWVQDWPEKTDARKFVFEDIAIAAWLVALWQVEREAHEKENDLIVQDDEDKTARTTVDRATKPKMQSFVDLGCGNGLLTHLLTEEGHQGKGIDIVSRKVWDAYGPRTRLEDELAPWVPIIASKSKPLTRFVVIPCCFFGLTGRYQFPNGAPEGKYKAYQDFICSVIETCGYNLQKEYLRIPSTKNVALVGMTRKKRKIIEVEQSALPEKPDHTSNLPAGRELKSSVDEGEDEGNDDQDEYSEYTEQVNNLIRQSGLFVPRVSDKERQKIQRIKQDARKATVLESHSLQATTSTTPSPPTITSP
ncbi:tRNA methyltransferase 44 [Podila epigama]|nr:tRNA methyltransferase 44 [Podila epigama]